MTRILIIGSTSVIGRALGQRLARSATVHFAGRREATIAFDLLDWQAEFAPSAPYDLVVHVAADFGGPTPAEMARAEVANAAGTLQACRLAHATGARRFVLVSSIFATYPQDHPLQTIYALSKRHGEETATLFCATHAMALTILRPTQVYDAAENCRQHQAMFYRMVDHAAAGRDIVIYGSTDPRRNYLYLDDLVEVLERTISREIAGTFACAHPQSPRLSEMASAAFAAFERGGRVVFDPTRPDIATMPPVTDFSLYPRIDYTPRVELARGMLNIAEHRACGASPSAGF